MASTLSLCRRCSFPEAHSRHVAGLAVQLFDQLAPLHGLGEGACELLECAALLHDIGEHVAREDHERHSAYLILNGRLRGFTPEEVAILASVCRYHRRGTPKAGFEPFGSLDGDDRERATALTALLRLADVLDRSHAGAVSGVTAEVGADEVVLQLAAARDITIELLGLPRKAELLERTFGRRVTVRVEGAADPR
jgi:exopolyphosphatase/guanosine-5'-triphosphate,3'-diphosphate pyrophosphatase